MGDWLPPTVIALFTAPSAGQPMQAHNRVEVQPGLGIPGDRYATRRGRWSDPRWPAQELTFIEEELIAELGVDLPALRRNVVVRGMELIDLVGLEFAVGNVRLRGQGPCSPCLYIEKLNANPGLLSRLGRRGGLRTQILEGGHIALGDEIRILGVSDEE